MQENNIFKCDSSYDVLKKDNSEVYERINYSESDGVWWESTCSTTK